MNSPSRARHLRDALLTWEPGVLAALVQWARDLPADWPGRVFGAGRVETALEAEPRSPYYAEVAPPTRRAAHFHECPACTDSPILLCRWHDGYEAAWREARDILRATIALQPATTVEALWDRLRAADEAEITGEFEDAVDRLIEESR
ncbi:MULTISPECIES: hypothetical protein [Streptomyces]|uniref:Uncharacterized protein n=1 Tax=Streptomyces evansiae TaxID=3075535 RepID=A0ABU2R7Y3_9ACTN|nr:MULTISPECIES: hypothetical protein [unclassified Streptomyces]MDT0412735.1 hypothetical protein [Streptomyces sp. DSM 41979]MYQ56429.1 hypothetical protein [Streptomyces sp. SID4926]SCE48209.1 hypothetical protein GA0115252_152915 [Streptomyces sp. DfronAA-171]